MPEIYQNFVGGFFRRANDENPAKSPLVFTISIRKCLLQRIGAFRCVAVLMPRPILRPARGFEGAASFADSRMTLKRVQPIRRTQITPDSIGSRQESGNIFDRAAGSHAVCPGPRSATRKYLLRRFIRWQKAPARENVVHEAILAPGRPRKNSPRRLRRTTLRYPTVERMSSTGSNSPAINLPAVSSSELSID